MKKIFYESSGNMKLGTKIKKLRKKENMTQLELAKKVGVSEKTIRRYETNEFEPATKNLQKIANVLNVDIAYLTEEENTICFKNWLKSYKYIPGTFVNKYEPYVTQDECDEEAESILDGLKAMKHLPMTKTIGIEIKQYLYRNCKYIKDMVKELVEEYDERPGLYLLDTHPYFEDLRFIFEEYRNYLQELDEIKTVPSIDKRLVEASKKMPLLTHTLPNEKSDLLNWIRNQDELIEFVYDKMKNSKLIKYDENKKGWISNTNK